MYTSGDVYLYPVGPVENLHKHPHSAIPPASFTRSHQEQARITAVSWGGYLLDWSGPFLLVSLFSCNEADLALCGSLMNVRAP